MEGEVVVDAILTISTSCNEREGVFQDERRLLEFGFEDLACVKRRKRQDSLNFLQTCCELSSVRNQTHPVSQNKRINDSEPAARLFPNGSNGYAARRRKWVEAEEANASAMQDAGAK
ncbi:hypothetical protein ACHAO8_010649 [Botrytis cinerea]